MKYEKLVDYIRHIHSSNEFDVSTPPDRAIFYSGRYGGWSNHQRARDYCAHHRELGFVTIEDTPGGQWLLSQNLSSRFDPETVDAIWTEASKLFAAQALSGHA